MGTVISIDFKRRCRTHASPDDGPCPGCRVNPWQWPPAWQPWHAWPGQAPLLMPWRPWLPSMPPQAPQLGIGVEEM